MVNIVAAAPTRSTAARAVVETAVRAWKMKYPTSKIDDCAVVCLFLDSNTNDVSSALMTKEKEQLASAEQAQAQAKKEDANGSIVRTDKLMVQESSKDDEYDAAEDEMLLEDYSALEGVTRVNTLLNLPRLTPTKIA